MNEAGVNLPALVPAPSLPPTQDEGWSRNKIVFLIVLAMIVHVALIVAFGTKKQFVPRTVTNIPQLQLADRADELLELDNPALFALPNPRDFAAAVWQAAPGITQPSFRYTEAPRWLSLVATNLGTAFTQFMQTNQFGDFQLDFKPPPQFIVLVTAPGSSLPQASTLKISGELARRPVLAQPTLPSLDWNDIIAPSKVQVTVDQTGNVISAVLLPADNLLEAAGRSPKGDTNAVVLARGLKFTPAPRLVVGEVTFYWHIIPLLSTNAPDKP